MEQIKVINNSTLFSHNNLKYCGKFADVFFLCCLFNNNNIVAFFQLLQFWPSDRICEIHHVEKKSKCVASYNKGIATHPLYCES